MNNKNNKQRGFTLIDQMIAVSIAVILTGLATPSISKILKKNQIATVYNEALTALNYTRSLAVTTGTWASYCKSNPAGTACATTLSTSWSNGWLVFEDENNNGLREANERIHLQNTNFPAQLLMSFSRNKNRITYTAEGYAVSYNGKINFCDMQNKMVKTMVISNSGRIRMASQDELGSCK